MVVLHQGFPREKKLFQVCCIRVIIPHFNLISLATSTGALQELHPPPERMSYDDRLGRIQELPKTCVFMLHSSFMF